MAGFNALAPDGLTSLGGYPGNDDKGREMQAKLDANKLLQDFVAANERLKADPSLVSTAADEIIRWVTPVRSATSPIWNRAVAPSASAFAFIGRILWTPVSRRQETLSYA